MARLPDLLAVTRTFNPDAFHPDADEAALEDAGLYRVEPAGAWLWRALQFVPNPCVMSEFFKKT